MSDSYVVRLERLRVELRDILREKNYILADDVDLATMIPKVAGIGTWDIISDLLASRSVVINDGDGNILEVNSQIFKGTVGKLTKINLPECTSIAVNDAFRDNSYLVEAKFPKATTINPYCFKSDSALTTVDLSSVTAIGQDFFSGCTSIQNIELPACVSIGTGAFNGCSSLRSIILRKPDAVVTLANINAFTNTAYRNGVGGMVYVPDDLISNYQSASVWSSLESTTFKGLSEL